MKSIATLLHDKRVLIADGGWTSELQGRGLRTGDAAEAWNVSHEVEVRALARDYAAVPVDVLTSNTFATQNAAQLERGIAIARDEAMGDTVFAVALGPANEARDERLLFEVVREAGATVSVLETQLDAHSCARAIKIACDTTLEVVASFTFSRASDGSLHTRCGSDPARAAALALDAGAHVVGANCCDGPESVRDAIALMAAAHPGVPLWAKPNAGVPERIGGALVYPESSDSAGEWALRLADAGARIVGGCCGIGPAHIAAVAAALRGSTRP